MQVDYQAKPDLILSGPSKIGLLTGVLLAVGVVLPLGVQAAHRLSPLYFQYVIWTDVACCAITIWAGAHFVKHHEFHFRTRDRRIIIKTFWILFPTYTRTLSFEAIRSIGFRVNLEGSSGLEMITIDGDRWVLADGNQRHLETVGAQLGALLGKTTIDNRTWTGPW